jgi:RHS repeat-associated protein
VTASTMPGAVSTEPAYNTADELTALVYKKTGTTFGQLNYGYDRGGLRTEVSGTFARTGIPGALATGTYDDANRLTLRGATTYTYDDVGNMTSDGTRTFAWNPRGQLTQITGGTLPASFVYDAKGRRRQAIFNGTLTSFLYDGQNVAQDLQGGSATVTYTNGLAVDSTVARTDAGGTQARLADALGSTVALTDGAGNVATDYTHDPFGTPTTLGAATSNRIGYAGREIDPTGLSFNRNRYYNPGLARFTSEDPIGLNGGQTNLFAYVGNDPIGFSDPLGLRPNFEGFPDVTGWIGDGVGWTDDELRERVQRLAVGCLVGVGNYVVSGDVLTEAGKGAAGGAAWSIVTGGVLSAHLTALGAVGYANVGAVWKCLGEAKDQWNDVGEGKSGQPAGGDF